MAGVWTAVSIAGIALALFQKKRGSSVAIVLAAIFLALGTLSSLILLAIFLSDGGKDLVQAAFLVPPTIGLIVPPVVWILLAIKARAARV